MLCPVIGKTWKKLKSLLNERSQSEKATFGIIATIIHSRKLQTLQMIKKITGCQRIIRTQS
jgi:hypothetical protein